MADLNGNTIAATYTGLLKTSDNGARGAEGSADQISDGRGNNTPLYLSATEVYALGSGSGTSNTAFGKDSGVDLASGGNLNALFGEGAGADLTTGENNVAVGYHALFQGTADTDDNVAIGYNAMSGAIVAEQVNDCVAIGSGALAGALDSTDGADESSGSVAIGKSALAALTDGAGNTAVGYNALLQNSEGNYNTAVGYQALEDANENANAQNVAVGYQAALNLSTGAYNTAIGTQAIGNGTTTGDWNVALGQGAGYALTSGEMNILIGGNTGVALTKGRYNTAVGKSALGTDDVGDRSTAFGYEALYSQNSLSDNDETFNTGLGMWAGYHNVVGTNNTYVGYLAGSGTSGQSNSNNTAVGSEALKVITDGGFNTAIGGEAGHDLTTGDENVFIGLNAGDKTTDVDKTVIIGANACGGVMTDNADGTIGIGYGSLAALTTGNGNVAVGAYTLDTMTVGDNNTAVGVHAGGAINANDGNDDNTFIGTGAGLSLPTASQSTCVGYSAGRYYDAGSGYVTADGDMEDCTLIGSQASASSNTPTNQTVIGEQATGQADNSVTLGNENVTAVYAAQDSGATVHAGGVAIGTATPGNILDCRVSSSGNYVGAFYNTVDTSDAYGIKVQCGQQAGTGTTYFFKALESDAGDTGDLRTVSGTFQLSDNSDSRLKNNIRDTEVNGLDTVNSMKVRDFEWKKNKSTVLAGFVAQELKESFEPASPDDEDAVDAEGNPIMMALSRERLVPVLVKAIQELSAKVKALEDAQ